MIEKINYDKNGHLWNNLSEDEKKDLLTAYEETIVSNNLLSHEEVKQEHEKWLKP